MLEDVLFWNVFLFDFGIGFIKMSVGMFIFIRKYLDLLFIGYIL